jgi:hypothetical protein
MTKCSDREAKQALRALFSGEALDADAVVQLRAHVAGCDECRQAYDKLGRVESALEGRALPASREAMLEKALFARLGVAQAPARAPEAEKVRAPERARTPERERSFLPRFFMPVGVGLSMAAAAMLVLMVLPGTSQQSEWQARGGDAETAAWGVRVFCIGPDGAVRAEASPGGTLVCGEGSSVQFSYTAPEAARLSIEARSAKGDPLRFFPREGEAAQVAAGVDVVLPFSTPVLRSWLPAPLEVQVSFTDAREQVISRTRITLSPR